MPHSKVARRHGDAKNMPTCGGEKYIAIILIMDPKCEKNDLLPFFLFWCWSFLSQFHQPTCCFSSEAGNLSRAFSADFMTQFLPSRDPRDPTDKIVITAIGLRLRMTQRHSWLTVIMVYLANLFNVLYIHDIKTDWVDPVTQPSQYWECDEKYDGNFSRVLENRHISSKSWYEL